MPWNKPGSSRNQQSEQNNKSEKGDKDPWTGQPKKASQFDLDAALHSLQQKLAQLLSKTRTGNRQNKQPIKFAQLGWGGFLGLLIVAWALWGFFTIQPGERGAVLRFGQYIETLEPGMHWMPRFIDSAYIFNAQEITDQPYTVQLLTRDQNIVSLTVALRYQITDIQNFLFANANVQQSLNQALASVLNQVVNNSDFAQLTPNNSQIQQKIQIQLIQLLVPYKLGVKITGISLQAIGVPDQIKAAFNNAVKARKDKIRAEQQVQTYVAQTEVAAKEQVQNILTEAKAYQQQVVADAKTDAAAFLALLPQYEKAPTVIRQRLFLKTMEDILINKSKVIIDSKSSNDMIYLPLDKLKQEQGNTETEEDTSTDNGTTNATMPTYHGAPGANYYRGGY